MENLYSAKFQLLLMKFKYQAKTKDGETQVGFVEAGNFHPDFILWLIEDGKQRIIFVDPKGIRNLGPTDPKIQFHATIKEIEQRLDDPMVSLHSFIVSNTSSTTMRMLWNMEKPEMQKRNILFQEEDRESYVSSMLDDARR